MPPRRHRGSSVLAAMCPRERECLLDGYFDHLIFDSDDHHVAAWNSVREEMLAQSPPYPEALFRFELTPKYGPRRLLESDDAYFDRHHIDIAKVVRDGA